jgi:glycosyltransferase involved in cell wall biosynthesis
MRVIHITPAYKPAYIYGGPTISISLLCEELSARNIDLIVFTTTANGINDFHSDENITLVDKVKVIYFKRILKGKIHLSVSLIKSVFTSTLKEDVYHIHSWWNATAILSALTGIVRGNKVIVSPRGMLTAYSIFSSQSLIKKIFQAVIGAWILKQCCLHVTSEKEKCDVLQLLNHKRIVVIPNLANNRNYKTNQLRSSNPNILRILFFSRIDKKKGLEILFSALSRVGFLWSLTIAGSGDETYVNYLKSEAEKLKLSDKISWIGFVAVEDKDKIFTSHDLLVLFSYNENFANVIIESLAAGLPVVISNNVGLASFVAEQNLGWVTENNVPNIISALESAFSDIEKRNLINVNAPSIVKTYFNEQDICDQYLNLYQRNEC